MNEENPDPHSSKTSESSAGSGEDTVDSGSKPDLRTFGVRWAESESAENEGEVTGDAEISTLGSKDMKRVAAQLIGRYYYQLIDGCGNLQCDNPDCASSGQVGSVSREEAAVKALQLFAKRARVCEVPGAKISNVSPHQDAEMSVSSRDKKLELVNRIIAESPVDMDSYPLSCDSESNCNFKKKGACNNGKDLKNQFVNNLTGLSLDLLEVTVNECKAKSNYAKLRMLLWVVFSNDDALQKSFLKEACDFKNKKLEVNIETTYSDISSDTGSADYLSKGVAALNAFSKEDTYVGKYDLDKDIDSLDVTSDSDMERSLASECNVESKNSEKFFKSTDWTPTVDVDSIRKAYDLIFECPEIDFGSTLINAIIRLLSDSVSIQLKVKPDIFLSNSLNCNIFIILLENPALTTTDYIEGVLGQLCRVIAQLGVEQQTALVHYFNTYWNLSRLKSFLESLHQLITIKLLTTSFSHDFSINEEENITSATKVMQLVYYASLLGGDLDFPLLKDIPLEVVDVLSVDENDPFLGAGKEALARPPAWDPLGEKIGIHVLDCRKPLLPFKDFYDEFLSDQLEMDQDFAYYKTVGYKFSFLNYPFILTPATKALGLYYDNRIRMYSERRMSLYQTVMEGTPTNPYLKLKIRRDHIVDDALVELEMVALENHGDFKKQLVVEFEGEQGIDEGGVSKEFFQLVVEQIFNPDYAMFCLNEETQMFWFNPTSFENEAQFTLIGIVLGLAMYNNVILDLHFPPVLYKKLCGKTGSFHDLKEWNTTLYNGLNELLLYELEDIEEVFMQTFRIGYQDVFGANLFHELKPDGHNIAIGLHNKQEFVELYADFLLNNMIEQQFCAFRRGFVMVTGDSPLLNLFRPEELELLVCGSQHYDFLELMKSTEYDGGYAAETPIIKDFWDIVNEMNDDEKKQLLQFTTGSARVPVGGLARLKLIIARHGPDTDRLPTAHTCFNVLLLPEYSSKDKLKDRLLKAIKYAQGFGML